MASLRLPMKSSRGLEALPAAFRAAGYTLPAVKALIRTERHLSNRAEDLAVFARRVVGDSPPALLCRLFLLNLPVGAAELERALPGTDLRGLEEAGLVEAAGGTVISKVRLVPHGDIYLASDRLGSGDEHGHVTGVNNPAILLADLAIRTPVGLGLDLGCGGGIQALLMSRHCERVIATDLNPRALGMTQLNAELNGVTNIECRLGSLFEPVQGIAFDLILCNPPYVISPESTLLYRDSGREADAFCRELIGTAPSHLAPGGFAQALVSWAEHRGETWGDILSGWVEGSPCDALFLHYSTEDPLTHAARWTRPPSVAEVADYEGRMDSWVGYCTELGIESIGFGSVTLRGRAEQGWRRADELRAGQGEAGAHIGRVFASQDFLLGLKEPRDLLEAKLLPAPGLRLEQVMTIGSDGNWESLDTKLLMSIGLGFQGSLDYGLIQLLQNFDGNNTVRQAGARAARQLGLPVGELESFRADVLTAVQRLLELGFFEISPGA